LHVVFTIIYAISWIDKHQHLSVRLFTVQYMICSPKKMQFRIQAATTFHPK